MFSIDRAGIERARTISSAMDEMLRELQAIVDPDDPYILDSQEDMERWLNREELRLRRIGEWD